MNMRPEDTKSAPSNRILHVAQVVTRMDVGGVPDHIMTLVRGLRGKIQTTVICGSIDEKHQAELDAMGVRVALVPLERLLSPATDLRSLRELVTIFRQDKFDVVHTHMSKAALLGGIGALLAKVPVSINTAHNLGVLAFKSIALRSLFWIYDRLLLGLTTDAIVTVSERVRAGVISKRVASDKKVFAIRNGIDVARLQHDAAAALACRREFGVKDEDILVVTVARLVWFKGIDVLIDAAAQVLEHCPEARFLIVGGGPLHAELERRTHDLGIADRFAFAGERRDVPALLGAADIFALSSVSEGMPISILEAMAAGKAVVATDVGGVTELVRDGETGFVVPSRDPAAFAGALIKLVRNHEMRRKAGAAGLERVRSQFSTDQMVDRTIGLYHKLHRAKTGQRETVHAYQARDLVHGGDTAEASPLVRQDYVDRYGTLLRQHLPPAFSGFAGFFSDMTRLETMAAMLAKHFTGTDRTVLNAGCGPFASEIFVQAFQGQRVTSFDYTAEFGQFFNIFRLEGLLAGTSFAQADAMTVAFAPETFDLIVMHDLLYEEALQLDLLLARYRTFLAPGGLIYFDYMNQSLRWLWRLLGREKTYRRYRRDEVLQALDRHGFEIVDEQAVRARARGAKAIFHWILRHVLRTSSTVAIVARIRPGP